MTTNKITPTREHLDVLLGNEVLRDPDNWIKVAEFFEKPTLPDYEITGICWMFSELFNDDFEIKGIYNTLSNKFFKQFNNGKVDYIWPTTPEYYPARAAFCREVAELLKQIKFVDCTPDAATMVEIMRRLQ